MRLLICAGGTGGGVYPALSILQALADRADTVLWVGGKGGMEADLVSPYHLPYADITAAGVHGVGLKSLPGNLIKLARGYFESRAIVKKFAPEVILFTGGYLAVPMALAASSVKKLLYVPDIEPGLALKTLAGFADLVALTTETSKQYFNPRKRLVVTGYPTREGLAKLDRSKGCKSLGLQSDKPVLLVMGGSKGSRSINNALIKILPEILPVTQVLHLSGSLDLEDVSEKTSALPENLARNYRLFPFLHQEMAAALSCADLVVARAGASTLGELPLFGLPAILVPYPYAWRYQKVNADYLVQNGAAELLLDEDLDLRLLSLVNDLLSEKEKLNQMKRQMLNLAKPEAANEIARLLIDLSGRSGKEQAA
jgi:UDP-N-acetylglucosamine--N-acetylmuramyl-(pentapeptide) pyrophosphoryl-undecaprenol N-acetylglucosamine transferase